MHKTFFGLQSPAFQSSPDPHFLCMTPRTGEVLACLQYDIAERPRIASAKEAIVSSEIVERVHHYSKGIARLVNLARERSMITAYADQVKPIPSWVMESVTADLDLHNQPLLVEAAPQPEWRGHAKTQSSLNIVEPHTETQDSKSGSQKEHKI
jgi:hypothetical protein